jgi:hypothetical protein
MTDSWKKIINKSDWIYCVQCFVDSEMRQQTTTEKMYRVTSDDKYVMEVMKRARYYICLKCGSEKWLVTEEYMKEYTNDSVIIENDVEI